MFIFPAVAVAVPVLWAETVPSLLSWTSCPPWILILPPAPVPDAVLNRPVPGPEIEAEFAAVTVTSPPRPAPVVLLSTLAPPVCVKLVTFSAMLPALPPPEVFTDIAPLSAIVNVGVDTVICPAFPVPTNNRSRASRHSQR